MKQILKVIFFVMITTCLTGCNDPATSTDQTENGQTISSSSVAYSRRYESVSISELGAIWNRSNPLNFIKLTPVNSAEHMFLCFDPNCKHPATTSDEPDPKCMAALNNNLCEVIYHDGAIYIFSPENIGENVLYKMNINGSSRERIATLPFEIKTTNCCISYGDKTYTRAKVLLTDLDKIEGFQTVEYVSKLVEIDLDDGTYRYISDGFKDSDYIAEMDLAGRYLYLRMADMENNGAVSMIRFNIDTGEQEIFISHEEWENGNCFIRSYDEDSYLYWDKYAGEIGIKNIDGTIEKILLKGPSEESFRAHPSSDGMLYRRTMDYEGYTPGYYFMDFTTWEVINITEEVDKYNLESYDGYYDVFIGREYIEEDDEKPERIYTTWSKDKILSEARE